MSLSRRAILGSGAVHLLTVSCLMLALGRVPWSPRPRAVVHIAELQAAPASNPAVVVPPIVVEDADEMPPLVELEWESVAEVAVAHAPVVQEAIDCAPIRPSPTLERIVRARVAPSEAPQQPPQQPPPAVAPEVVDAAWNAPTSAPSARVEATPMRDNQPPEYPYEARQRRQQGEVVLLVAVDAAGGVEAVRVEVGSGFGPLDRAAVRAVSRWRFEPAKSGGLAVASETRVTVEFRLDP